MNKQSARRTSSGKRARADGLRGGGIVACDALLIQALHISVHTSLSLSLSIRVLFRCLAPIKSRAAGRHTYTHTQTHTHGCKRQGAHSVPAHVNQLTEDLLTQAEKARTGVMIQWLVDLYSAFKAFHPSSPLPSLSFNSFPPIPVTFLAPHKRQPKGEREREREIYLIDHCVMYRSASFCYLVCLLYLSDQCHFGCGMLSSYDSTFQGNTK